VRQRPDVDGVACIDIADLEQTSLVAFGSRVTHQRLVKTPEAGLAALATALRADAKNSFVRVRSYSDTEGDMGEDFARAENYLSLVGLVIVILGGVGISSVTRVFVQQKLKSIAILKCLGARGSQVLAIYVLQVVALGLLGSAVGVLIALGVMAWIPAWLGPAVTAGLDVNYRLTPSAVIQGAGTGLLVSLLFSLVPLLDVRHVKPSRLLRADAVTAGRDWVRWAAAAGVGGAVLALTMWQAGSVRIGGIVAIGFAVLAAVLYVAGVALIAAVRPLAAAGWFQCSWRHGQTPLRSATDIQHPFCQSVEPEGDEHASSRSVRSSPLCCGIHDVEGRQRPGVNCRGGERRLRGRVARRHRRGLESRPDRKGPHRRQRRFRPVQDRRPQPRKLHRGLHPHRLQDGAARERGA